MKTWKKIGIALVSGLGLLILAARLTGVLQNYIIPTPSSEPGIREGQHIFFTNLGKPSRDEITAYKHPKLDTMVVEMGVGSYNQVYVHRLCGMENDVVQMKAGVFYVNGKNADLNKNLLHYYLVPAADVEKLAVDINRRGTVMQVSDSLSLVNLTGAQVSAHASGIHFKKYFLPSDTSHLGVFAWYGRQHEWSADEFGPVTIPAGYCFMLGDNRQNSMDSRWTGFVKLTDIVGIKL